MQESQDAFMCEDVQRIARDIINDRQTVHMILHQRLDGIKQAGVWRDGHEGAVLVVDHLWRREDEILQGCHNQIEEEQF